MGRLGTSRGGRPRAGWQRYHGHHHVDASASTAGQERVSRGSRRDPAPVRRTSIRDRGQGPAFGQPNVESSCQEGCRAHQHRQHHLSGVGFCTRRNPWPPFADLGLARLPDPAAVYPGLESFLTYSTFHPSSFLFTFSFVILDGAYQSLEIPRVRIGVAVFAFSLSSLSFSLPRAPCYYILWPCSRLTHSNSGAGGWSWCMCVQGGSCSGRGDVSSCATRNHQPPRMHGPGRHGTGILL